MPNSQKDRTAVWILGDQLNPSMSALEGLDPSECTVLLVEAKSRAEAVSCHKHKLALVWSAMRHFAEELREQGYQVDYRKECQTFRHGLERHLEDHATERLRLMETAERGRSRKLAQTAESMGLQAEVIPNNFFLSNKDDFAKWAEGRKSLTMESFYRRMRKRTGLLMEDGEPAGGRWNYDKQNRETPEPGHGFPSIRRFQPDRTTQEVINMVQKEFAGHFGTLEHFFWPVTRTQAQEFLEDFLDKRLDLFGPFQDAIVADEPVLYHSLLSSLLNIGLLDPLDVCRQAEQRWKDGKARLNSVEGFIRQIIGWREFIYQVYQLKMPGYIESNELDCHLPLPDFYWTGETDMRCVANAIGNLRRWGSNHHIQRLMVTGNFALIAGIEPKQVNDWYMAAYADAYEWVVAPNVLGMALYADGGFLASKPYAASANYINKMSDCCADCYYNHRKSTGGKACPFNSLYWDFLARNRSRLSDNPRMNLVMANLDKRDPEDLKALRKKADAIREALEAGERV